MENENNHDECCPKFDPTPWDNQIFEWDRKKFIKGRIFTFNYMPLTFGLTMRRLMCRIETDDARVLDNLCLSDHTSKWNMNVLLAVDKSVKNARNIEISGTFMSKVYEGGYENTAAWGKDFEAEAQQKGFDIKKWFMWYTTCPKCAQKYGKNYVAIIAEVCKK